MGRAENAGFHERVTKPRQKAAMEEGAVGGDSSFGDGLAAAARSIIADARTALADTELSDAEAVHEVRKALKRWRACSPGHWGSRPMRCEPRLAS